MGISYHSLYTPDGAGVNLFDRLVAGTVTATYPSGASAGVASTVAVTWGEPVPTPYTVLVSPVEDSTYFITSKTATSCILNVAPRLAASTLAGGTVEVLLFS